MPANEPPLTFARPQLECPTIIAVIFVAGIGGTFQYGFCVSVMNSPSAVRAHQDPAGFSS